MSNAELQATDSPSGGRAGGGQAERLQGKMGTASLVLTVLALSAPLGTVAGVMPLIMAVGNGPGAPGTYAVMGLVVLLFAVGFITMARNFPRIGAFYAYVTGGLGKSMGLGTAFLAQLGYLSILVGTYAFFGDQANILTQSLFGLPSIPWWVWGGLMLAAVTALGHFNVEISGRVLVTMMALEVLIVMLFNIPMLVSGGPAGYQVESFTVSAFTSGSIGLGILFASANFIGFETTAIYRSEVKDPDRTVPRATYLAIVLIAIFYVISAWALVTFYGADRVNEIANASGPTMFANGLEYFTGHIVAQIMTCLVVTSLFAATLSTHNPMARYFFALARDGVYPTALGRVNPKRGAPSVASAVTSAVSLAILLPFIVLDVNAVTFYSWMFGIGTYALLLCMLVTSIAVVVYFRRVPHPHERSWNTLIAPVLGFVGLAAVLSVITYFFPELIGGDETVGLILQVFIISVFLGGVVLARVWRRSRPSVYARIGGEEDTTGTAA